MKQCNQCEKDYSLDYFYSYKNGNSRSICKKCAINNTIQYRERKKEKNKTDSNSFFFSHNRYKDYYRRDRVTQRNRNVKK